MDLESLKPTKAYILATWVVFIFSVITFGIGLFNAEMQLNEKGFYISTFIFGLYSVVTLQKTLRDKVEGIKVSAMYYNLSLIGVATPILLTAIGLFNAELQLNEKGFFAVTYITALFSSIVIQKNTRDIEHIDEILHEKENKFSK